MAWVGKYTPSERADPGRGRLGPPVAQEAPSRPPCSSTVRNHRLCWGILNSSLSWVIFRVYLSLLP